MKLKAGVSVRSINKICPCCKKEMAVIRNTDEYLLCSDCIEVKEIGKTTLITKKRGKHNYIHFTTDCKHLD